MERSPEITHKIMSSIKSSDTRPELELRKALWQRGFRYRVNYKQLKGKPDIVFTKAKIAVFCDGDYWHGHNWALRGYESLEEELSSYSDFWKKKITENINRDNATNEELLKNGWLVIRVWESSIKADLSSCIKIIEESYWMRKKDSSCVVDQIVRV